MLGRSDIYGVPVYCSTKVAKCQAEMSFLTAVMSNILAAQLESDSIQIEVAQCQTVFVVVIVVVIVRPFDPKAGRSCLKRKFKDNPRAF